MTQPLEEIPRETLEQLVGAALRAPSGDNTQPWRFQIDPESSRIAFFLDETRDPSPMNAGQRMARIAIGAALENLLQRARAIGLAAVVEPPRPPALALVRITGNPAPRSKDSLRERVTNRRLYDGRPLSFEVLERLRRATPPREGVTTQWIVGADRLEDFARLIARGDEAMLGEPSFLDAFLRNVRFDAPRDAPVEEGLSLDSLELDFAGRLALRLLPRLPRTLRKHGVLKGLAAHSRKLVESASALCLLVAPDAGERTDLIVGQALENAWLAVTDEGLAAQPMMSLLILESLLERGSPGTFVSLGKERLETLRGRLRALAPQIGAGRPAFLLRVGFAPPPTGRVGRRPVSEVLGQAPLRPLC